MPRSLSTAPLALLLAGGVTVALAQSANEEEIVERILELRRQAAELEEALGPEARAELARRLAGEEAGPEGDAEPAAESVVTASVIAGVPVSAVPAEITASEPRCPLLAVFDSDDDGRVTGLDRHWRYLHLWIDRNGDDRPRDDEMVQLFDLGIRSVEANGAGFETEHGGGDIRRGERLVFAPVEKGRQGTLAVDATRLQRGTGPTLIAADGRVLEGIVPLDTHQTLRLATGERERLTCR